MYSMVSIVNSSVIIYLEVTKSYVLISHTHTHTQTYKVIMWVDAVLSNIIVVIMPYDLYMCIYI